MVVGLKDLVGLQGRRSEALRRAWASVVVDSRIRIHLLYKLTSIVVAFSEVVSYWIRGLVSRSFPSSPFDPLSFFSIWVHVGCWVLSYISLASILLRSLTTPLEIQPGWLETFA